MNRRTFIKVAAASFATLFTGCGVEEKFSDDEKVSSEEKALDVKFLRQIVTKKISDTRLVMWEVDEPLKNPAVEVKFGDDKRIFPAK